MQRLSDYLADNIDCFEEMKNLDVLDVVSQEVNDIFSTDFEFPHTTNVPNVDDGSLTYENGITKRGKEITTCVLFVDIRNSVELNQQVYTKTMGRIYTAFTKSVLRAAAHCGGYVRNIIGDRVMVVFPEKDCFKNAVDCAITINHLAQYVINPHANGHDFSCGIGVDYGKMRCIKVGVEKHGTENSDNKNLVWIGEPANFASRLCDVANKEVEVNMYIIEETEPVFRKGGYLVTPNPFGGLETGRRTTRELTEQEFLARMSSHAFKSVLDVKKRIIREKHKPILLSDAVFLGFKKDCPHYNSIKEDRWELDKQPIRDISFKVYGANLRWKVQ